MEHHPPQMQAAVSSHYGGPRTVTVQSVTKAVPKPNEVLIRVTAAASNPIDYKIIAGNFAMLDKSHGKHRILGHDVCGTVVEETHHHAHRLKVGDKVVACLPVARSVAGTQQGTWAEYVAIDESFVAPRPSNLTDAQAAGLPLTAVAAHSALDQYGQMRSGERVLVIGASGGVGMMVVQLAKAMGASHVAGVCSAKNAELVKNLGADAVADYEEAPHWREILAGDAFDLVVDCVGGAEAWRDAQGVMKPSGARFVTLAGDTLQLSVGTVAKSVLLGASRGFWSMFGYPSYRFVRDWSNVGTRLAFVCDLAARDELKVIIDSEHPFTTEGVQAAITKQMTHRARGKIIIQVQPEDEDGEEDANMNA